MNIEQACTDAVNLVQSYLDSGLIAADMYDELCCRMAAVDYAWDECMQRKSHCQCRTAWHAVLAAKHDKRDLAKMYATEFWEYV
jgi:hypothetical protein